MGVVLTRSADAPFDTETTCSGARTTRWAARGGALVENTASRKAHGKRHRQTCKETVQLWREMRTSFPRVKVRVFGTWSGSARPHDTPQLPWDSPWVWVLRHEFAAVGLEMRSRQERVCPHGPHW